MKPVDQRYFRGQHRPMGDCLRACVASIFELELDEVPHFVEIMYQREARHQPLEWEDQSTGMLCNWAWSFGIGLGFNIYARGMKPIFRPQPQSYHPGFWIASVASRSPSYGTVITGSRHAIVMNGPDVAHDPNPDSRAVNKPYRFGGEMWFELAHANLWLEKIDPQEIKLSA